VASENGEWSRKFELTPPAWVLQVRRLHLRFTLSFLAVIIPAWRHLIVCVHHPHSAVVKLLTKTQRFRRHDHLATVVFAHEFEQANHAPCFTRLSN